MTLRRAVLAAALLALTAAARAQVPAAKADRTVTPELLIKECGSPAKDQAAALAVSYKREIHEQASARPAPIALTLTRGGSTESVTLIADAGLKTFFEGSAPDPSRPGLPNIRNGCRVVATSEQGWAALGYVQARMTLARDIKRIEQMNKVLTRMREVTSKAPEPRDEHCEDQSRRDAAVDALAFKKLVAPEDASSDALAGDALIPLAQAKWRCD